MSLFLYYWTTSLRYNMSLFLYYWTTSLRYNMSLFLYYWTTSLRKQRVPRPVEKIPTDMDEVTGIAAIRLSLHFINELFIDGNLNSCLFVMRVEAAHRDS
uniref:Uncharacterized protein n=1 Tax=Timema poppense TaxID=170557 RepID=A0A7R9DPD0_TIMPO|nr:unnamed protein product [Timema poppensis]